MASTNQCSSGGSRLRPLRSGSDVPLVILVALFRPINIQAAIFNSFAASIGQMPLSLVAQARSSLLNPAALVVWSTMDAGIQELVSPRHWIPPPCPFSRDSLCLDR